MFGGKREVPKSRRAAAIRRRATRGLRIRFSGWGPELISGTLHRATSAIVSRRGGGPEAGNSATGFAVSPAGFRQNTRQ